MLSKGIQVKRKLAEKLRRELSKKNLVRKDLRIERDDKYVYFPVERITQEFKGYGIIEKDFKKIKKGVNSYKEILEIPDKLKRELPTSYDIVGDIILIKLQTNLLQYKYEIGKSLLKTSKNIKTICLIKPVEGEFRIRDIEIIAGEKRTKTIHKEYNLIFEIDISKTYFSPRLATERKRVADLVKPDEVIVDMFAGVAPFSIIIAKYACPRIVYALDKNKDAIYYAKQNIVKNNVLDKIEVIYTDAKNIQNILNRKKLKANRIIMNLPFSAYSFFEYAIKIIANNSLIHYYDIIEENKIEERINGLKDIAKKNKVSLTKFNSRRIKTFSPREFYMGIDITAKKDADVA